MEDPIGDPLKKIALFENRIGPTAEKNRRLYAALRVGEGTQQTLPPSISPHRHPCPPPPTLLRAAARRSLHALIYSVAPGSTADARHTFCERGSAFESAARCTRARTCRNMRAVAPHPHARRRPRGAANVDRMARHAERATSKQAGRPPRKPQGIANVSRKVSRKRKSRLSSASSFRLTT